jgi:hypothetical protein
VRGIWAPVCPNTVANISGIKKISRAVPPCKIRISVLIRRNCILFGRGKKFEKKRFRSKVFDESADGGV